MVAYLKNDPIKNSKWTRRDLNPGPPHCECGALPLSYEPFILRKEFWLIYIMDAQFTVVF